MSILAIWHQISYLPLFQNDFLSLRYNLSLGSVLISCPETRSIEIASISKRKFAGSGNIDEHAFKFILPVYVKIDYRFILFFYFLPVNNFIFMEAGNVKNNNTRI